MKRTLAALFLLLTTRVFADAVADVHATELAFAKAFADRDKDKFFSFVADDATFLAQNFTLHGKQRVIEGWSRFFEGPAPFAWAPDRVSISADGTLALSSGPVYDPDGRHAGSFISTWRKQADGTWKIVFDSSGPGPVPFEATKVEEGFVPTPDGVKLYYRKVGRGPVFIVPFDLLLHDQVRQFADLGTVITYDMRNRGRSARAADQATWTLDQDVKDLETVRAHFKAEKFMPIGFSYLGKMVMLYAAAHPDRVRRVIQLAPAENVRGPAVPPEENFGAAKEDIERWRSMDPAKDPRAYCLAQWNVLRYYLVGDPKNGPRVAIDEMCSLENEWPVNVNRVFERLFASSRALSADELAKITAPVLTIHGTRDRHAPYRSGQEWVKSLPNARLVTVEGAAHALWIDEPVKVFTAMRAFLRGDWPGDAKK